jgi:hypothetical protein
MGRQPTLAIEMGEWSGNGRFEEGFDKDHKYTSNSRAWTWRLQYFRVIEEAGAVEGVERLV